MLDGIKKTTIGENTYQINLLPARKGIALATKISKALIPSLGASFDALKDEPNGFSRIAILLANELDNLDVVDIIDSLLDGAAKNSKSFDWDVAFVANYKDLLELVTFALKENFGSFFEVKGLTARFSAIWDQVMPTEEQSQESTES